MYGCSQQVYFSSYWNLLLAVASVQGAADLADVLRLHIFFKYEVSQLSAGHALQQPAGLVVLRHPPLLPDLSNCGSAYLQLGFEPCPLINVHRCQVAGGNVTPCMQPHIERQVALSA